MGITIVKDKAIIVIDTPPNINLYKVNNRNLKNCEKQAQS